MVVWSDDAAGTALSGSAATVHPDGVAATVGAVVRDQLPAASVTVAGLHEPDDGVPESLLDQTDVLVWWGHNAHHNVSEDAVEGVALRIREGLGLVALHSAHHSKLFCRLMGTSCDLQWREAGGDEELIWTVDTDHPIAAGIEQPIRLGRHEMYGEPFCIPQPDRVRVHQLVHRR